ncbi:MAG: hypothetical protein JXR03_17510 [Cyclobacteriaceae bacterium]
MKRLILVLLVITGCSQTNKKEQVSDESWTPKSWIEDRASKSEDRLKATQAGAKVWRSIEAHGGLDRWFSNGPIGFRFDYKPLDGGTRRNTYQTVDQWSVTAVHKWLDDESVSFGWDGKEAWLFPDSANIPINPRFWSTTPFYFLGLPFVLADDGINYEELPSQELDGAIYDLVKVTYQSGTGDAPGDYYVIYINQETQLMGALRYIVSYPGFFQNGGHFPEKIMRISGLSEVDGVKLSTGYQTFWWKEDSIGEHITNIDVLDVSFNNDLDKTFFNRPDGAKVQQGY